MKTKMVNGKKHWEKKFLRFYDGDDVQEFTLITKKEMLEYYREYLDNASEPQYADAVADDSFQVDSCRDLLDSKDDEISLGVMKDAHFILFYNPNEFMAYLGRSEEAHKSLMDLGGEFKIEKEWVEL